jgi:hypothetical protein
MNGFPNVSSPWITCTLMRHEWSAGDFYITLYDDIIRYSNFSPHTFDEDVRIAMEEIS